MKTYIKTIDGISVIKPANEIIIEKDGMDTFCPTEDMILEDGWEELVFSVREKTDEDILNETKERVINEIVAYDSSDSVNVFYINGYRFWFDKMTRVGLALRFESELKSGKNKTTLWLNGVSFEFEISKAMEMFTDIEIYASSCYDITQQHVFKVKSLDNIKDVESYDYRNGYPEVLIFNL
jgi:hypothetical protein